ncbi:MAG: DMT family transporter [Clostridia bacterium]|nr:DMT family transporter [Clostridia bacterium]
MEKIKVAEEKSIFTHPLVLTLSALLCCALWGSATPFIKIGYELMMPEKTVPQTILFAGIRFTLAGIITVLIYSIARKKLLYPKPENIPCVLTVSAFQTVIQYIFFYIGLANTTGVKGTIASGSSAFFCVLIASLVFRQEKLTAKKIIACILGFAGIIVVNLDGLELTMNFLGDGFVIFSTISYAFSSVLMKRFSKREDPVVISGYQFIVGGSFMIMLGLILGGRITVDSPKALLVLLYLSLLSAVAYALWGMLLKYNPVSRVSIFSFTTPIFGTLLSLLMLPESTGVNPINLVITLLLVSGGIFLLNYQKKAADKSSLLEDKK